MATKPMNVSYREKGRRKSRGDRLAPGSIIDDAEVSINGETRGDSEQEKRDEMYAAITSTVEQNIRDAITARESSGIEFIWREDDDQYNGVHADESSGVKTRDQAPRARRDGRSRIFVPITKPKTDVGVARVSELLLPTDEKPWDATATPMPDIDEMLEAGPDHMTKMGDGTMVSSSVAAQFIKDKADEFCKAEELYIEDRMIEGEVYSEMRQVLRDAGRIGTGVIKGPYPVRRITNKWHVDRQAPVAPSPQLATTDGKTLPPVENGNVARNPQDIHRQGNPLAGAKARLERIERIEPTSTCIRVQDCYPDPSCGDNIHDGAHFTERAFLTGKALKDLAFLPGYDAKAIILALKEGPHAFSRRHDSTFRSTPGDTNYDAKLFEVFYHYCDATPDDLEALMRLGNPYPDEEAAESAEEESQEGDEADEGEEASPLDAVLSPEDRRFLRSVPIVCTMLNGRPIRAELNPMEVGGFPYDFFPWEPVKGQPYGRGVPRKIGVAQRMLNAGVGALLENAGLSAGAQIVIAKGAVRPVDGKSEITGRKLWEFDAADAGIDDVRKAFAVFSIPSVAVEMTGIVKMALEFADLLSNLPMLLHGDEQPGAAPETLGGLKMYQNNAMSPLRVIAKLFDDRFFNPHLKRWHNWAMEKGPDSIKGGDTQIVAKGSAALIQREEGREFLVQLFPVKDDPKLRIDPIKMIAEMSRGNGFNMKSIQYTEDEWKEIEQKAAQNPPPPEPAIEAARIRSEALVESAKIKSEAEKIAQQSKAALANLDRVHEAAMAEVDRQIADMEQQGRRSDSLVAMKARLAEAAASNRLKSDELHLKLMPENKSGTGI